MGHYDLCCSPVSERQDTDRVYTAAAAMMVISPLEQAELVGRLALAAVLAGVLGWERQLGQQPAGLRTHMLVSIGSAAFTMAGTYGVSGLGTVQDAGRIAAQIVTGIGFIGAGTIWRSSGSERVIRGLTTAASIWVAASIGMLCGYGLYVLAAGSALVSFTVLRLLRGMERVPGMFLDRIRSRRRVPVERTPLSEIAVHSAEPPGMDGMAEEYAPEGPPLPESASADPRDEPGPAARAVKSGRKQRGKKPRKRRRPQTDDIISD